jgi:glucosamine-6-phosphate deaminase
MNLSIEPDYAAVSCAAAERIARLVRGKPDAAVMVATGNTPRGTYARLAEMARADELDLAAVRLFQLDAYLGEDDSGAPPSFYGWLRRHFLDPAGMRPEQLTRVRGDAADPRVAATLEEEIDRAGGLSLAILGLGINGHVGFNEPPARGDSRSRVVELSPETVDANHAYWDTGLTVPTRGVTAGIATIRDARELLMLVTGIEKAEILRRALEDGVSDRLPASHLCAHPGFRVIADREAASRLADPE